MAKLNSTGARRGGKGSRKGKTASLVSGAIASYGPGMPTQVICDNGKEFRSLEFVAEMARLGINVIYMPAYVPAAKAAIERKLRTLDLRTRIAGFSADGAGKAKA